MARSARSRPGRAPTAERRERGDHVAVDERRGAVVAEEAQADDRDGEGDARGERTAFPATCPAVSSSRKKRPGPRRRPGSRAARRAWPLAEEPRREEQTHSGAVSWMKIAFAAVVSFVARTNSTTVNA